jgi:hypothetical protein
MLIAGGRSSVAWATTKALVRRRDIVLGTHTLASSLPTTVRRRSSAVHPAVSPLGSRSAGRTRRRRPDSYYLPPPRLGGRNDDAATPTTAQPTTAHTAWPIAIAATAPARVTSNQV